MFDQKRDDKNQDGQRAQVSGGHLRFLSRELQTSLEENKYGE